MSITTHGTALVTGASAGIGAVYAGKLARRGHDLVLVARDLAKLEALAAGLRQETGRRVEVLRADLTDGSDLARVEERIGRDASITLLVNNAGMTLKGGLLQNDTAAIRRLVDLNVTAPTALAAAAAKVFPARGESAIVNIASVLALAPEMLEGVYSGSKAFLINMSQKLARDLAGTGVRVQVVLPGATRTEIWEKTGADIDAILPGMVMEAGDLVDAALAGLDRGELVTIPPLAEEALWQEYERARLALAPHLSRAEVAPRYRAAAGPRNEEGAPVLRPTPPTS